MSDLPKDDKQIWEKVLHTDARVTAMEGQLNDLSEGVARIEAYLLNRPAPNYLGWAAACLTGFSMLVGALWMVIQYVNLTQEPLRSDITHIEDRQNEFEEFKHQTHYEFGILHEYKRTQERVDAKIDSRDSSN